MTGGVKGRVLVVAGSDSGGGAGIQGDIKTITALGGYAATAITALTAQNTLGVQGVLPVPPEFIEQQLVSVLSDLGADSVKTGMLGNADTVELVAAVLAERARGVPLVLDPVMVAKGGARLLDEDAVDALRRRMFPLAAVVTPNVPEAEALAGMEIPDLAALRRAGAVLLGLGLPAVLLKGGHLPGPVVTDLLVTPDDSLVFESQRIDTRHTHGTGCTLASAVATGLAQGRGLADAVRRARAYVQAAIQAAPGLGGGHGPLGHGLTCDPSRFDDS